MGFFSDLKEDLSQAVNELMPEDEQPQEEGFGNIDEMLERVDSIVVPEISALEPEPRKPDVQESPAWERQPSREPESMDVPWQQSEEVSEADQPDDFAENDLAGPAAEEEPRQEEPEKNGEPQSGMDGIDLEKMLENALAAGSGSGEPVYEEENTETITENQKETKGESKVEEMINARMASDETSSITAGMTINGDVVSEGSVDLIGCVNGNIDILGKLNVTGYINGNSKAAEIYADNAKVNGEIVSEGAVKIGSSSVVIGNICATSAVIAGAVKGDIDVKGPVILDTSAIVMGNIKSKSVQINNGAVIEGMCSQCYAEVNPISFFDDYKPEVRNNKNSI